VLVVVVCSSFGAIVRMCKFARLFRSAFKHERCAMIVWEDNVHTRPMNVISY
jgi:hypothetical protein